MGPWDPAVMGPIAGAIMVVSITAGIAGVLIFRPFTKQLGELLEQMRRDRQRQQSEQLDVTRVGELMESMVDRLERLEARQEFTEHIVERAGWSDSGRSLPKSGEGQRPGRAGET